MASAEYGLLQTAVSAYQDWLVVLWVNQQLQHTLPHFTSHVQLTFRRWCWIVIFKYHSELVESTFPRCLVCVWRREIRHWSSLCAQGTSHVSYNGWNGFKFPNTCTYCFALSCPTLQLLYLVWLHKISVLALLCSTSFKISEIKLHSIYGSEWWRRCTLLPYPTYCFIHTYSILLGAKQQNVRWQLSYEKTFFWVMRRHLFHKNWSLFLYLWTTSSLYRVNDHVCS